MGRTSTQITRSANAHLLDGNAAEVAVHLQESPTRPENRPRPRFPPGNRFATRQYRASIKRNPLDQIQRDIRQTVKAVRSGELIPAAGSAIAALLRLELEVLTQLKMAEKIVEYEAEVRRMKQQVAALIGERNLGRPGTADRTNPGRVRA